MSQSLSQQWTHIIFSTKERFPYFTNKIILENLFQYIQNLCLMLRCQPCAIGGIEDHLHILVNLNRKLSLSHFIEDIKRSSSKWIKSQSNLDSNLSKFYWQRGYGAFSVSQSALENVRLYINNQQTHHQTHTFQEELKLFLIKHKIEFNEAYLWR